MSGQRVLSEEQYDILHRKGTEPAFSGKYYYFHDVGTYVCAACGNPIFSSSDKFDCGCGCADLLNVCICRMSFRSFST